MAISSKKWGDLPSFKVKSNCGIVLSSLVFLEISVLILFGALSCLFLCECKYPSKAKILKSTVRFVLIVSCGICTTQTGCKFRGEKYLTRERAVSRL